MKRSEPAPVNVADWPLLDDEAKRAILERLRPVMREIAEGLGAHTPSERATVLEAVGLACLVEAGWGLLALGRRTPEIGEFL